VYPAPRPALARKKGLGEFHKENKVEGVPSKETQATSK